MEELYRPTADDDSAPTGALPQDQEQVDTDVRPDRTPGLRAFMDAVVDPTTHDFRRLRMVERMNNAMGE